MPVKNHGLNLAEVVIYIREPDVYIFSQVCNQPNQTEVQMYDRVKGVYFQSDSNRPNLTEVSMYNRASDVY